MRNAAHRSLGLWRGLLIIHGIVTMAAAIVLVAAPSAIPSTVGVTIHDGTFLLCYFLAAAEFAVAVLSLGAIRLTDPPAVRLVVATFVAFHLASAALEVLYLALTEFHPVIIGNVAVRLIVSALFLVAGRARRDHQSGSTG